MGVGLTYAYGRIDNDTTESGTRITRVAGQFTSPFTACPVRVASTHRLRLPVTSSQTTSTVGSAVIYLTPDNAYNGAGQPATGVVWSWYTDANNKIELLFTKAGAIFSLTRTAAGVGTTITIASTFAANTGLTIYIAWSATTLYIALNGGAITSGADANIPTLTATVDIGSRAAAANFEARYDAVAMFARILTLVEWQSFDALRASRPPLFGEFVHEAMTELWYGSNSIAWTLASGGTTIDLRATTNARAINVTGMGVPLMEHRHAETPLRDGASYIDSRMRTRTVGILMRVFGATMEEWHTARTFLIHRLNPRLGQGLLMHAPATQCYEVDAVVNTGIGMTEYTPGLIMAPQISFSCFDPTVRVSAFVEDLETIPQAGWALPWVLPWSWSTSAVTFSITNDGDIDAWPTLRVIAGALGCTSPYFTNNTTGKTFALSGGGGLTMAAAAVLKVDMKARTADIANVNKIGFRSDASQMWPLTPGVNSITVGVDSGSGTTLLRAYKQLIGV